jgi:hypothetical protein
LKIVAEAMPKETGIDKIGGLPSWRFDHSLIAVAQGQTHASQPQPNRVNTHRRPSQQSSL